MEEFLGKKAPVNGIDVHSKNNFEAFGMNEEEFSKKLEKYSENCMKKLKATEDTNEFVNHFALIGSEVESHFNKRELAFLIAADTISRFQGADIQVNN